MPTSAVASTRFPLVEGLRAVAALAILVVHAGVMSGYSLNGTFGDWTARLDAGVPVFFALSAFLLYRPFVASRLAGRPAPDIGRYARRRALRILPAYWLALTVTGLLFPSFVMGVFTDRWWSYYLLQQQWSRDDLAGGLGVAWSLSVEALFYVVLPIYAVMVGRLVRRLPEARQVQVELVVIALSAMAAVAARWYMAAHHADTSYHNSLPGCWAWFCGGLALAVASAHWGSRPVGDRPWLIRTAAEHPWAWWLGAFLCLAVSAKGLTLPVVNEYLPSPRAEAAGHTLYVGIATLLVGPVVLGGDRPGGFLARMLGNPVAVWLGVVSYGIFLWHQPLVIWLAPGLEGARFGSLIIGGFVLAVSCAAISWYALERPVLNFRARRHVPRPDRERDTAAPALEPAP